MKIKHEGLNHSLIGILLGFCYVQCSKLCYHVPPKRPNKFSTLNSLRNLKTSISTITLKTFTVSSVSPAVPWPNREQCAEERKILTIGDLNRHLEWQAHLTLIIREKNNSGHLMLFKFNYRDYWAEKPNISESSN